MEQHVPTLQESLTRSLSQLACDENFEWKKICICQRSRDLNQGEFVIPKGSCPKCIEENPSVLLKYIQPKLSQLQNVDLPCQMIDSDKFNHLRLHVSRTKSFRNVIATVQKEGSIYGHIKPNSSTVSLSLSDFMCNTKEEPVLTPSSLRQLLILQHVQHLLTAHGYTSKQIPVDRSSQVDSVTSSLGLQIATEDYPTDSDRLQTIISRLRDSKYRETLHHEGKGDNPSRKTDSVVINLRQFIEDTGCNTGKLGFDKNLNLVDVCDNEGPKEVIESVARLQSCCQTEEQVVHIVSEGRSYTQQQVHLLWRMTEGEMKGGEMKGRERVPANHSHLVLGSVTGRAGQQCCQTAQEFVRMRFEQMKEASVMKYGDEVQGQGWETTLSGMTAASIAFEMLTTASRNTVKLDLSAEDQLGAEMRSGAFVMYNCARLATLFRRFNGDVKKGVYPPLPDVDEVNFDLLKEEEEWELLFNFVYSFPDVLLRCVERVRATDTDIHAKIHTHKISNFLVSLSRSLSSYYSRIHILGDGKSHLLPVMYARLCLMDAVHQVLKNGLHLMGLQPPTQL